MPGRQKYDVRTTSGFSIIEVLVAVGILGIILVQSLTFFRSQLMSSKRSAMKTEIWTIVRETESLIFEHLSHLIGYAAVDINPVDFPGFVRCDSSRDYFRRADPTAGYDTLVDALTSALTTQGEVLKQYPARLKLPDASLKAELTGMVGRIDISSRALEAAARCSDYESGTGLGTLSTGKSIHVCFGIRPAVGTLTASRGGGWNDSRITFAEARYLMVDSGTGQPITCETYSDLPEHRRAARMFYSVFSVPKVETTGAGIMSIEWHHVINGRTGEF